jgi:hypothetical protein
VGIFILLSVFFFFFINARKTWNCLCIVTVLLVYGIILPTASGTHLSCHCKSRVQLHTRQGKENLCVWCWTPANEPHRFVAVSEWGIHLQTRAFYYPWPCTSIFLWAVNDISDIYFYPCFPHLFSDFDENRRRETRTFLNGYLKLHIHVYRKVYDILKVRNVLVKSVLHITECTTWSLVCVKEWRTTVFNFMWPCILESCKGEERTNYIQFNWSFIDVSHSTCFRHHYARH